LEGALRVIYYSTVGGNKNQTISQSEVEWGAAKPEKRASTSGSMYSEAEFIAHYGGTNEWRASALLAELGGVENPSTPRRAESHSRSQLRKQRSAGFGAVRF
jgi:hypothetical protein